MAKYNYADNGGRQADRNRVNWGNGGSSLLQVNHQYHFPTSKSEFDFVDHDTWVGMILDDTTELALSTICRSKVGTPLNGGQPITYQCDGSVVNVVREVARSGGDLNALLLALQHNGTGLVATAVREFIHTYQGTPTIRRVYTLEFWGTPLDQPQDRPAAARPV